MPRTSGQQFHGSCKFWNAVKGYGFLTPDDGGPDLFVSQHDLVTGDSGFRALTAGQRVECIYTVGENGKAIAKTVTGPNGVPLRSFKDMYTAKREIEAKKPPDPNKMYGTIKWFNAEKSFGFIIPKNGGDDVFFHFSECLKGIVPAEGDLVEYNLKQDKNGKSIGATVKNKTQKKPKKFPGSEAASHIPSAHMSGIVGGYQATPTFAAPPTSYAPPTHAYAPPAAYGAPGRKSGTVKFFDESKGYGFIVPSQGGRDIHVHKSNVMGGELVKDEAVEYEEQTINGKVQAVSVSRAVSTKRGAGGAVQDPYAAAKRPRVMYDIPSQATPQQSYPAEYQYFDPSALNSGAPRYY